MTIQLRTDQWPKILDFLRHHPGVYVGQEDACRRFIEGVLWITRTGAQWRELPEKYGRWNSVYQRFSRWCERGLWRELLAHFAADPDLEWLLPDSTVVRAHPCAAGAAQKNGGQAAQALGRSRGGFSTKIHVVVDALGNPLDFVLTPGQAHDSTQAKTLLKGHRGDYVIADKSYDADDFIRFIEEMGAVPVVPPQKNRKQARDYDAHLYAQRYLVECFFNKIKWFRRIFARFEKLDRCYLGFLSFVATLIWLR